MKNNMTIMEAVKYGAKLLTEHNIENADYDSFALLAELNSMDRTYYFMHGNDILSEDIEEKFKEYIDLRSKHMPLQHILGKAYFYGYEYEVNENVLVPRSDTEVLVEQVLKVTDEKSNVIDMCTGSGCIILTIAKEKHLKQGYGIDISAKALAVANNNCSKQQVENVKMLESNLFADLKGYSLFNGEKADVIVSNPPYIRTDVIETLSDEVKLHDPFIALDGYEDGLYFYREITRSSVEYLKQGGWLMYEIGYDQGTEVGEIMKQSGYKDISVIKDLAGLDRVVIGRLL